jgi:hypothetical protein
MGTEWALKRVTEMKRCSWPSRWNTGVLSLLAVTITACSDNQTAGPLAAGMEAEGRLPPTATVNTAVTPAVVLVDSRGRPQAGVRIMFEVTGGGGSMAEAAITSDRSGRAEGVWTLGRTAGENGLVARSAAGATVTFTVTGTAAEPALMEAVVQAPAVAAVSAAVTPRPAVRVVDSYGNGVAGVAVEFAVQSGGGTVSDGSQTTDSEGIATAGTWTVGAAEGENVIRATATGLAPVTFTTRALAVSGERAALTKVAGDDTTCPVNTTGCSFTVEVVHEGGGPAVGEPILWRGAGGATSTTVTNAQGRSTSPNIGTRTQTGSFEQRAQLLSSGDEVTFRFRVVAGGGFRIDLRYVNDVSPAVRAAFDRARARWEQVITGNLPEFALTGANQVEANACGITHPAVNEVVDDLLIFVEVVPIDGPGKVLGSAGPCMVRAANGLPILGVVKLDADDLELMAGNGMLGDVVLHEIGHVLGIGTLWRRFSLLQGAGTSDPLYTGERARSGFLLGGGAALDGVPVESGGGSGTRDSHWREATLGSELMTGWINTGRNPLSSVTVGSLMDMGYQVNFGASDGYALPGSGLLQLQAPDLFTQKHELVELPLPPPRRVW